MDSYMCRGLTAGVEPPVALGADGAGVVIAVGEDAHGRDRRPGRLADGAGQLRRHPDHLSSPSFIRRGITKRVAASSRRLTKSVSICASVSGRLERGGTIFSCLV
ncbi:hypothetical protein ACWGQ5_52140 [Streptomyces sp. NPDC055722]